MRGQRFETGKRFFYVDCYNANPASMKAAIDLLSNSEAPGGRRIAVLGDMLELGSHSARLHSALAEVIRESRIERLYLAGAEMSALRDELGSEFPVEYREKGEELLPLLVSGVGAGDAIMIKSSNGIGFSRIVDALAARFPGSGVGPGGD